MTQESPRPTFPALQTASHPLIVTALVAWILNDHLFKGLYGNWATGKASDVFGLIVFPVLIAVPLQRWAPDRVQQHALPLASTATAIFFVTINLSATASDGVSWVLGLALPSSQLTPDPTDLLTLPALIAVYLIQGHERSFQKMTPRSIRTFTGRAVMGLGLAASMATAPPPDPGLAEFTGTAVLTAETPALELPLEFSPDGPAVDTDNIDLRWSAIALGETTGTPDGSEIETSVTNLTKAGGVARFELADDSLAPVELQWEILVRGESVEDPIVAIDAPDDETIKPEALATIDPIFDDGLVEWVVTTESNTTKVKLGTVENTVEAVTDHGSFAIDGLTATTIPLPPNCPETGCQFGILLAADRTPYDATVKMWADEPITVEEKQRDFTVVAEEQLDLPNTSPDERSDLEYELTINIEDLEQFDEDTDYVTIRLVCDPEKPFQDQIVNECDGDHSFRVRGCCDSPFRLEYYSITEIDEIPKPVTAKVVVSYLSIDDKPAANPLDLGLTAHQESTD